MVGHRVERGFVGAAIRVIDLLVVHAPHRQIQAAGGIDLVGDVDHVLDPGLRIPLIAGRQPRAVQHHQVDGFRQHGGRPEQSRNHDPQGSFLHVIFLFCCYW
ncbi:hypothetical protein ACSZOJ_03025 [Aeromonas dhakensis]